MLRYAVTILLLLWVRTVSGQIPEHQSFPAALCKSEDVRLVTVFETVIEDPVTQAGRGNRIRLARNMVRSTAYDREGRPIRSLTFTNEGKTMVSELLRLYNEQQLLASEQLNYYNTNYADSTKLLQTRKRTLHYGASKHPVTAINALVNAGNEVILDSVAYDRDGGGKLLSETVYDPKATPATLLTKEYKYEAGKVSVLTKVGDKLLNRDVFDLDAKGRIIRESNYGPGDAEPRLVTVWAYDPRGWLEEQRMTPNWQHFSKDVTVVSRKYKYDDHGKLVEVQLDYGNGKRLFEFYDYSYWVEN